MIQWNRVVKLSFMHGRAHDEFVESSIVCFSAVSSVQFSRSVVSDSFATHGLQHARPPCPSPAPGVYPNSCPLSRWCHPTISSSMFPSPPSFSLPQHQGLFKWVSSSHQVAKVLEFQLQHQSFQWTLRTDLLQDGLVGSPCSTRDSQESSLTPQFKSINSLALSFLHHPTLTSIHDHWKNHLMSWMKWNLLSCVQLFVTPWTVAYQAPPSMGFSRQEYWSGLLFPSPGDLPNSGIEPRSPALQAHTLISEPPGKYYPLKFE